MQCMQCEFVLGYLVLVDLKDLTRGRALPWHGRVQTFGPSHRYDQESFGVCLVSIIGEHQREVRESGRLKRKILGARAIITCEEVPCLAIV